jgi:hypothetical protein
MSCKNCNCDKCRKKNKHHNLANKSNIVFVLNHLGHNIFKNEVLGIFSTDAKWFDTKTLDEMIQFINEFESKELSCEPFEVVYTEVGSQNNYNHINTICGYQPSTNTFKILNSFYKEGHDIKQKYQSEGCGKFVVLDDNIKSLIKELFDIRKSIKWPVVAREDIMKQRQCSDIQERIISEGIKPIDYFTINKY